MSNIYNVRHTYLGIPIGDSVYIYAPPSSQKPNEWSTFSSLPIPEGTIATDGNIRKNIFLTQKTVIFEEMGRYDTLHFNTHLPPIDPRVWIRGPQSTEADMYFLSERKNTCYYRDFDESEGRLVWRISDQLSPNLFAENQTHPTLTERDGFNKLYSFNPGLGMYVAALLERQILFYRYPTVHDQSLDDEIVVPADLTFPMPDGAVTAFIYDSVYIAVVSPDRIDFYDFDRVNKQWAKVEHIPTLHFSNLPNNIEV